MVLHPHYPRRRRGTAAAELALLAPVLLLLLLGLWEIGRLVQLQQQVANAAREGGRQASAGKKTKLQVREAVLDYLANSGLATEDDNGQTNVTVAVTNETSGGEVKGAVQPDGSTVSNGAVPGDRVKVVVTFPFANARWVASTFFVPDSAKLQADSEWVSMVDKPITVSASVPRTPR